MQYEVEILAQGERVLIDQFDELGAACDYTVAYVTDEYAENPAGTETAEGKVLTLRELMAAVGALQVGFANGGDFAVTFQGENIRVSVVYDNLAEMMAVLQECEVFAVSQDDEAHVGPEEIAEYVALRGATLAHYGKAEGKWSMRVDTHETDITEWHGDYDDVRDVRVWNGRVSWGTAFGVVTAWQETTLLRAVRWFGNAGLMLGQLVEEGMPKELADKVRAKMIESGKIGGRWSVGVYNTKEFNDGLDSEFGIIAWGEEQVQVFALGGLVNMAWLGN